MFRLEFDSETGDAQETVLFQALKDACEAENWPYSYEVKGSDGGAASPTTERWHFKASCGFGMPRVNDLSKFLLGIKQAWKQAYPQK